jgi:two-component system, LuxR family, sensor kinase FixL
MFPSKADELQAIVETATDGLLGLDERWFIRWTSPSTRRMFGYSEHELIGMPIDQLYADAPPAVRPHPIEVRGRRRDGSIFPMELTLGHTTIGGARYTSAVVRDITERRLLEQQLLAAADELQTRIGRDLHDGLGQLLTGIAFIAHGMAQDLDGEHGKRAARIVSLINEAIRSTRELARGLSPAAASTERSFRQALQELVRSCGEVFGVPCSLECGEGFDPKSSVVCTQLYFITREAITNAVRHGQASRIDVSLTSSDHTSMLCVRNDGRTIAPETPTAGFGVRSMQYRARLIGGTLEISPRDGGGTVVACRWAA